MKLFLFCLLFSQTIFAYSSNRDAEEDAKKAMLEATYKQTGVENNINKYIENRIPKKQKEIAGRISIVVSTIITQKASYKWTF